MQATATAVSILSGKTTDGTEKSGEKSNEAVLTEFLYNIGNILNSRFWTINQELANRITMSNSFVTETQ